MSKAKESTEPSIELIQALRTEWGFSPDPYLIKLRDTYNLIDSLYESSLGSAENELDQDKVADFLEIAVSLYDQSDTPIPIKQRLHEYLSPQVLEQLVHLSSKNRWNMRSSELLLNAYCTFLTIETLLGDKAKEFKKEIAFDMIFGREFDVICDKAAFDLSTKGRNVIQLGSQGTEVAQCGIKLSYLKTNSELSIKGHFHPYYRNKNLLMGDPKKGMASPGQILADLIRVLDAPKGAGVDLASLGMAFDNEGELIQMPGVANISGNLITAVGKAVSLRQRAIELEGKIYDKARRNEAYRKIRLEKPTDTLIVDFGDGSWINLGNALEYAKLYQAPIIFICENNQVAIGTTFEETQTTPIAHKGKSTNIPGIGIKATEIDKIVLATRFAAIRAALDAGPTIIEVETFRDQAHSAHHGNHLIPDKIELANEILSRQLQSIPKNDPRFKNITEFMEVGIFAPSRTDRLTDLKKRLEKFYASEKLDSKLKKELEEVINSIVDPMEVVLKRWQSEGTITEEQLSSWYDEAKKGVKTIYEEVSKRSLPNLEQVGKFIHAPFPQVIVRGKPTPANRRWVEVEDSDEVLTMNKAEAQATAITEAMLENPALFSGGIDVNVGKEVKAQYIKGVGSKYSLHEKGGYFHQMDGVWPRFGKYPGRFWNFPIGENVSVQFCMGFVTDSAVKIEADLKRINNYKDIAYDPRKSIRRAITDWEYGDYGIQGFEGLWINSGIYHQTSGQVIRPLGIILPCGMAGGGGGMHSHNVEAIVNQLPEGMSLFTVSDPKTYYELLRYGLRYINDPYVIVVDRFMFGSEGARKSWRKGTGFFEPGRDIVIQQGDSMQVITWGPMTEPVKKAAAQTLDQVQNELIGKSYETLDRDGTPILINDSTKYNSNNLSIGIFEKVSWRPSDNRDLVDFLTKGSGTIYIATEDFKNRSLGNQLITKIVTHPILREEVYTRRRPIEYLATLDVSHPYCDEILMNAIRPTTSKLAAIFHSNLTKSIKAKKAEEIKQQQKFEYEVQAVLERALSKQTGI